ncbi:DUF6520 family protein [Flavobacterium lacus]|uniref:Uncharacterized protein n=1 Tax=Flavobacterium lacus TaxID=1353778 RepID=A0A328WJU4_9FLAO|nr:DUF6520 family protein [Flavobacterium lacus]RAR46493.1 hypothetical protein B0I10_11828 [Flavobacterium lacus]
MKTINFKSILPLLLMIVAITSAFAFQNESKKSTAVVTGWVDHPAPCSIAVECENEGTEICTAMYQGQERIVRGKESPNDLTCSKTLFRLN